MFIKIITTLCLQLIFTSNLLALETDQYMTWVNELNDSTKILNAFFNHKTWQSIKAVNQLPLDTRKNLSCEAIHEKIIDNYNKNKGFDFIVGIEKWIYEHPTIDRYPRKQKKIGVVNESIYRNSKLFKLKIFGINIKAGNVYFGIDKLGHIIETGQSYYKIYSYHLKQGKSEQQAILATFKKGILQEKTYYGYWISGVFSFADLEANYQGLLFHNKFCNTKTPYLKKSIHANSHQWLFNAPINIADFINPYLDESFNTNTYSASRFRDVYPYLKKYCVIQQQKNVKKRRQRYQKLGEKSISTLYLEKLVKNNQLDDPKKYSLATICQKNYQIPALVPESPSVWEF